MSLAASTISHGPLPTNSSSSSSGVVRFVSPLVILRVAYEDGQSSCVLQQRSGGGGAQNEGPSLDQLVLQHRNCFLDARAPTGLESRKREPFCVGDVWLLLATPKENYNYLFTTQKGFKYINVLDRQRVVSAVTEAAAPPLSAAAAAAHESAAAEAAALSAGHKLRVFALDPAKPVLLPGDEETPQHASTSAAAAAAAAQQQRAELHWLLPQWFEGEADMLLWAAAPGASSEQDASSSSSSSTRLLRVQRPLHLRSCSVLCRGFSFEEVLKEMVAIEAARRAKRPLDTFAYKTAKPAAAAPAAAAASAMGGQQQVRKMPGRTSAASLLAHPRPQPSSSRFCVLDEVCVHLKRRPVLLLPSLAASGPGCLLTRENVKVFLEGGGFVDPRQAHKNAVALGGGVASEGVGIRRQILGREFTFKGLECTYTSKFEAKDWASVVCVFVCGGSAEKAKWQFNGWPFPSWVELFQSFRGVLFAFEEDTIPPEVLQWNVRVFRLSRSHRHNDAAAANDFWRYLEEFLLAPRQLRISSCQKIDASAS